MSPDLGGGAKGIFSIQRYLKSKHVTYFLDKGLLFSLLGGKELRGHKKSLKLFSFLGINIIFSPLRECEASK